jgi:acyl dehydratase
VRVRVFGSLAEFVAAKGKHLGFGDWLEITQDRVNRFADATDDHQWIHVDAERAAAGPFGGTVAHGYLTLSLIPALGRSIYRVEGLRMSVNYGSDKVRFPSPVRVGARVRGGAELVEIAEIEGGAQAVVRFTIEIEGQPKPGCVADILVRMAV